MTVHTIGRRMFLRGLGAGALSIPFLPSLSPSARAASSGPPRRFIALKSYNGQTADHFYPSWRGGGMRLHSEVHANEQHWSGFQKAKDMTTHLGAPTAGATYAAARLSDFARGAGEISPVLGPWLNPYADKLSLLRGLDSLADINHNDALMLGNASVCLSEHGSQLEPWPTIDQVLAYSPSFYQGAPRMRSLNLVPVNVSPTFSANGRRGNNTMSYTDRGVRGGPVEPVGAISDPRRAFDALFGKIGADDGARRRADTKLVDAVFGDYQRVRDAPRLSSADRARLEQHMTHLSELQERLGSGPIACAPGAAPPSRTDTEDLDPATIRQVYADFVDLIALAIKCDITRVITLDMVKVVVAAAGAPAYGARQVGVNPGSWHNDAHALARDDARARILAMNQWLSREVFARLLGLLDVEEQGGRTYLDNSLVYWGNEMSGGQLHFCYSMPCVLAGGAGGALQTGRYIDYIDWTGYGSFFFAPERYVLIRGVPYNRLLITILQAMGLNPEHYERPGLTGYGSYARVGIDAQAHQLDYDEAQYGAPLPALLTGA